MVRLGDVSSFVPTVNPTSFAMCVEEKEANCCGAGRRASSSTGSTNSSQTCFRASTIELTQLAIRTKIVYLCLVKRERRRERRREKRSGL
jgi:hypothetical protein